MRPDHPPPPSRVRRPKRERQHGTLARRWRLTDHWGLRKPPAQLDRVRSHVDHVRRHQRLGYKRGSRLGARRPADLHDGGFELFRWGPRELERDPSRSICHARKPLRGFHLRHGHHPEHRFEVRLALRQRGDLQRSSRDDHRVRARFGQRSRRARSEQPCERLVGGAPWPEPGG